jgi:ribosomal protein S12 methylthiotransferase
MEEGTRAALMKGQVREDVKKSRRDEIMCIQREISEQINRSIVGRELDVLIDEADPADKGIFLGRSYMDAPEIDGTVFVKGSGIKPGDMVKARVIDGYEYDLVAEKV